MTRTEETVIQQRFEVSYSYSVTFTRSAFDAENLHLAQLFENRNQNPKILPIVDANVLKTQPTIGKQIKEYFAAHHLAVLPMMEVAAGESSKTTDAWVQGIYDAVVQHKIDRHSYIIAVGGGAVIDAVGYAAATAHRGIRLVRMPTTVLAQNDAAVGVKNAINFQGRKNFLGTFAPPHAVICDFALLDTLSPRDKRAGIAEAVKVALIKDPGFFHELYTNQEQLAMFEARSMENMIIKGAKWHLDHIANQGDPFETGSSRPLDFGHWSAHKLEELSKHQLRHGEAVAIGIAMDSIYSHISGLLSLKDMNRILALLLDLGFQLYHPALEKLDIPTALHEFKEHLGGRLCIMLLTGIGRGVEVDHIDAELMIKALQTLAKHARAA
ncbi:MAG: 3-dehydroquinate synthase [Acidiferrobacterales bacterium]|nr:3-dehydroquinate synthase [Acidiferrobacterales bacterium]